MKKKRYDEVSVFFESKGCILLEEEYTNNLTKMRFICSCGRNSAISFNQFKRNSMCKDCGIDQMRSTKTTYDQPCRTCEKESENMMDKKYGNICRPCYNEYHAGFQAEHSSEYYQKHKTKRLEYFAKRRFEKADTVRQQSNESYHKTRRAVLEHYSPNLSCNRCGFKEHLAALSIDHVNGDGAEHRKKSGVDCGRRIYYWLKRNNFPKEGFQVLCMNCQFIKRYENNENRSL